MLNPYNDASVLGTHVRLLPSGLLSGLGATARIRRSGRCSAMDQKSLTAGCTGKDSPPVYLTRAQGRHWMHIQPYCAAFNYKDVKRCIIKLGSYFIQISNL